MLRPPLLSATSANQFELMKIIKFSHFPKLNMDASSIRIEKIVNFCFSSLDKMGASSIRIHLFSKWN